MISRNKMKLIRSLSKKKFRDEYGLFIMEGKKMLEEILKTNGQNGFSINDIYATASWIETHEDLPELQGLLIKEASEEELKEASSLVTPQEVMAVVRKGEIPFSPGSLSQQSILVFEAIRDPGNLGTIIRTADWFGIRHIVCSPDSVDCYNPKVVQSTMGAITRVKVLYEELETFLSRPEIKDKKVYGTLLEGESLYECALAEHPVILFGNESRGISPALKSRLDKALSIPSFSGDGQGSESLNLASSVAIVCSELRRPTRSESLS